MDLSICAICVIKNIRNIFFGSPWLFYDVLCLAHLHNLQFLIAAIIAVKLPMERKLQSVSKNYKFARIGAALIAQLSKALPFSPLLSYLGVCEDFNVQTCNDSMQR